MNTLIEWFEGMGPKEVSIGGHTHVGMTAAGASLVFPFKTMNRRLFDGMLGGPGGGWWRQAWSLPPQPLT